MSKMIQVRNVPDRLHRELARRAKRRGQTLTAFVQEILEREVARPDPQDVYARIEARGPLVKGDIDFAALIRAERREAGRE
jgi:plasmid stability protein